VSRRLDALRALASQSESPREAEIAREKLAALAARDAASMDPYEPCGDCGKLRREHRPKPSGVDDPFLLRYILGWHAYVAAWEQEWADYRQHERIAEAKAQAEAKARQEAEIAELVKRWERGTYSGMTVGGGAKGARIGK